MFKALLSPDSFRGSRCLLRCFLGRALREGGCVAWAEGNLVLSAAVDVSP